MAHVGQEARLDLARSQRCRAGLLERNFLLLELADFLPELGRALADHGFEMDVEALQFRREVFDSFESVVRPRRERSGETEKEGKTGEGQNAAAGNYLIVDKSVGDDRA